MKNVKIILFTIIFFIQSLPTFSVDALDNGLENNGIICYNLNGNVKKDIFGLFFFSDKSYKRYTIKNFEKFKDFKEFDGIPTFWSKDYDQKYKITDDYINTHMDVINRFKGVNYWGEKISHSNCDFINTDSYKNNLYKESFFTEILWNILQNRKELYLKKLKKRKF